MSCDMTDVGDFLHVASKQMFVLLTATIYDYLGILF